MKEKTIVVTFKVKSEISNFELCNFVETILQNSTLGSSPFALNIIETKVTKESESDINEK